METMSPSSSLLCSQRKVSTVDELSMQQSLLFSESLKDLRSLRSHLYSAAEYFEMSYTDDGQKQLVMNTLKDYAIKALLNTVDHLGSVSYKVNGLLDENSDEVSATELRMSCIEQRLRSCQELIDREGRSQQSLLIAAPKYHKRYILPVGVSIPESGRQDMCKYQESNLHKEGSESQEFQAVRSAMRDRRPSSRKLSSLPSSQRARSSSPSRKVRSPSPTSRLGKFSTTDKRAVSPLGSAPFARPGNLSITDKRALSPLPGSLLAQPGKFSDTRANSPLPIRNPFARSGSMSSRSNVLQNSPNTRRQFPLESQKSASMLLHAERNDDKEIEQNSGKSRGFLKALLTRRRSKKDDMLYTYLDEY